MSKKGFTLIELLAVIVILAIVAIIATPIVLDIISDSKESSRLASAEIYIDTVEKSVASSLMLEGAIKDGIYKITDDGNVCIKQTEENCEDFIEVKIQGIKPEGKDDYVYYENKKLKYYKLTYNNYSVTNFGTYPKQEMETWINVKEFGAVGDGITDDTEAIKSAVNYINENGGVLYFPLGTYIVSLKKNKEDIMSFNGKNKIVVELLGSSIVLSENSYTYYNIVKTNDCEDFTIRNGTIIGDRVNHDYVTMTGTHEFGYGIFINSTKLANIQNMNISQLTGDGIVNLNWTESNNKNRTIIENSEISYVRRNGLAILATDNIEVNNVKIHHVGTYDGINGASPQSGIDIEPASGSKVVNMAHFNNLLVSDITNYGVIMGANHIINDYKISNSNIENPSLRNANVNNSKLHIKEDALVTAFSWSAVTLNNSEVKIYKENTTLFIIDSTLNNTKIEGLAKDKIKNNGNRLFLSQNNNIVTNCTFENFWGAEVDNITSKSYAGIPYFYEPGKDVYHVLNENSYNNMYKNCKIHISTDAGKTKMFGEINSTIEDSILIIDGNKDIEFNKINFYKVDLKKRTSTVKINFNDCVVKDSIGF